MQKHSFYLAILKFKQKSRRLSTISEKKIKIKKNVNSVFHKITAPQNQDTKFPPIGMTYATCRRRDKKQNPFFLFGSLNQNFFFSFKIKKKKNFKTKLNFFYLLARASKAFIFSAS